MSGHASVQARHLRLDAIADDSLCLGAGRYRAVLEVEGIHFGLLGEDEQEAILSGFAGWLNGLAYPVQMLVRVSPWDLDRYVAALERRARDDLGPEMAALARDHMAFLHGLARERTLLERRLYLVVPGGSADERPRVPRPFGRVDEPPDASAVRRQLTARCEEVARGLGRCRLTARRLSNLELAQLLYAHWCPERARLQRLHSELSEYAALTVRGRRPPERNS